MPRESVGHSPSAALATLLRWEDSGAVWRVIGRGPNRVTVGLFECTGGEEVDRFSSSDPDLLRFLGDRRSSEDSG